MTDAEKRIHAIGVREIKSKAVDGHRSKFKADVRDVVTEALIAKLTLDDDGQVADDVAAVVGRFLLANPAVAASEEPRAIVDGAAGKTPSAPPATLQESIRASLSALEAK
jgi:hypothetical protein